MDRRQFLTLIAGGTGVTAGCAAAPGGGGTNTTTEERAGPGPATDPLPTTADRTRLAHRGNPPTICQEERSEDPGIYAVTDPAFAADWTDVRVADKYRPADLEDPPPGLSGEHTIVGLSDGSVARAFPLGVLWHHEIVNASERSAPTEDPVIVTYCPLCSSGVVGRRVVDGSPSEFLVSGLLWKAPGVQTGAAEADGEVFGAETTGGETPSVRNNGNLVMWDRETESFWSQILTTAICGPMEGTEIPVVGSTVATWAEWTDDHPDTEVLLPPPHSGVHSTG